MVPRGLVLSDSVGYGMVKAMFQMLVYKERFEYGKAYIDLKQLKWRKLVS